MDTSLIIDTNRVVRENERTIRPLANQRCVVFLDLNPDTGVFDVEIKRGTHGTTDGIASPALTRALQSDPNPKEVVDEIKRLYELYDVEERLLCVTIVGQTVQIDTLSKPWIDAGSLHRHCACGARVGADPEHDADHAEADIIGHAGSLLANVLAEHDIPPSHGYEHAAKVMNHTRKALEQENVTRGMRLALLLASLLHDADDRKYFAPDSNNAEKILGEALRQIEPLFGDPQEVKKLAMEAISYVSASKNGNKAPSGVNPLMLYPRHSDRLEAVGEIGVVRCYQYTKEVGRPLYLMSTPLPTKLSQVDQIASEARFQDYQLRGSSASMVDHIFDKLIPITRPLIGHTNPYYQVLGALRLRALYETCMAPRPGGLEARIKVALQRVDSEHALPYE